MFSKQHITNSITQITLSLQNVTVFSAKWIKYSRFTELILLMSVQNQMTQIKRFVDSLESFGINVSPFKARGKICKSKVSVLFVQKTKRKRFLKPVSMNSRSKFNNQIAFYIHSYASHMSRMVITISQKKHTHTTKKEKPSLAKTQGRTIINLPFKHFHQQISCIHFKQHINSISWYLYTTLSVFTDPFASSHVISFSLTCKLALAHTLCISGLYER